MKKNSNAAWLTLFAFVLNGCTTIKIKDDEICGDKGTLGASCFRMLSEGSRRIPKQQWDDERFGQLCMSSNAFGELKAALLKLCESTKCTFEDVKSIQNFGAKVDSFKRGVAP